MLVLSTLSHHHSHGPYVRCMRKVVTAAYRRTGITLDPLSRECVRHTRSAALQASDSSGGCWHCKTHRARSGDMYRAVPICEFNCPIVASSILATPKSEILTSPSLLSSTLAGFKSLCTILC